MAEKEPEVTSNYIDILLVGKTGLGKSTTGNILLGLNGDGSIDSQKILNAKVYCEILTDLVEWRLPIDDESMSTEGKYPLYQSSGISHTQSLTELACEGGRPRRKSYPTVANVSLPHFPVGEGAISTTTVPKLVCNKKSKVRVLDTPGFTHTGSSLPIVQANLELIRQIAVIQETVGLKFRYVVYFLPHRGPPQNADRLLKDEITVLHHYFGESIWRHLLFVLTAPPEFKDPKLIEVLTNDAAEKDAMHVIDAALVAVRKAYGVDQSKCKHPNFTHIVQDETYDTLMGKLKKAGNPKEPDEGLALRSEVCKKCFAVVKLDCETKIAAGCRVPIISATKDGHSVSTCHPKFERSMTLRTKHWGQLVCVNCHNKKGKSGCIDIGSEYKGYQVTHQTKKPMETVVKQ